MNSAATTHRHLGDEDENLSEPANPRLDAWIARTTTPLDLLALFTIWLTVVPFGDIHKVGNHPIIWYTARIAVSFVYFIDITVRTRLAHHKLRYLAMHPISIVAVIIPAIRLIFSLRLLGAMFRKGNLFHFLFVSVILLLNMTLLVYGFEHHAPGANITSLGDSIWWACVTVFTVGYGDFYPITTGGRIFAVAIMALGLLTAAVITAQIASSFMDQAAARRAAASGTATDSGSGETPDREESMVGGGDAEVLTLIQSMQKSIADRLDSIESHLHRSDGSTDQT